MGCGTGHNALTIFRAAPTSTQSQLTPPNKQPRKIDNTAAVSRYVTYDTIDIFLLRAEIMGL